MHDARSLREQVSCEQRLAKKSKNTCELCEIIDSAANSTLQAGASQPEGPQATAQAPEEVKMIDSAQNSTRQTGTSQQESQQASAQAPEKLDSVQ